MNSLRRLWAITQKELRQLARDRLTFGMVVMILDPAAVFGYAINTDVRQIPVGLGGVSQSVPGRLLVESGEGEPGGARQATAVPGCSRPKRR